MAKPLSDREELLVYYIRTLLRKLGYEEHVIESELKDLLKEDDTTKNQTHGG